MEVASAIVGLLLAGAKVYTTLEMFVSSCRGAPDLAQEMLGEVRDFQYALKRLRKYTERPTQITPLGAVTTDIGHLSLTLGSCMATFSQLERTIDRLIRLPTSEMTIYGRLRWVQAGTKISEIVRRLQQHKATITMLLTIWISESTSETELLVDSLNDTLRYLTSPTKTPPPQEPVLLARLPSHSQAFDINIPTGAAGSLALPESDAMSVASTASRISLKSVLRKARPYRGLKIFDQPEMSIFSLERGETHWSSFSGGSTASVFSLPFTEFRFSHKTLAEEKAISRVKLPVDNRSLYRPAWYRYNISENIDEDAWIGEGARGVGTGLYQNKPLIPALRDRSELQEEYEISPIVKILHTAVSVGDCGIVSLLIDRGLRLTEMREYIHSWIPMSSWVAGESRAPLLPVVSYGEQVPPLLYSRETVEYNIARYFLAEYTENNTLLDILIPDWMSDGKVVDDIPLIHLVVESGTHYALETLLEKWSGTGAIIPSLDKPLEIACQNDNHAMIKLLVSHGAVPNTTHVQLCLSECIEGAARLHALIPDWMAKGKSIDDIPLIHFAVQSTCICALQSLLDQRYVSSEPSLLRTLLGIAVREGNELAKKFLISRGATLP